MTDPVEPAGASAFAVHLERVRRDGYTVLERAVEPAQIEALKAALVRLEREQGYGHAKTRFEGLRTVRINNLLALDEVFWDVPLHPMVLGLAEALLDRELLLSSFCSLLLDPGQEAQPMHEDTQQIPLPRPHVTISVNAIWALSDFTEANGATRIVPGSHRYDGSPEYGRHYESVAATLPAGSIMVFDSALWHAAGANTSDQRRWALSCYYCAGWIRQQENLQLGIPREWARRFPRRLQELCGYSVYRGQWGHIDNHDPIELLGQPRGKRMVWEASDVRPPRQGDAGD
jgi:ectoine hydroxylase-related dioxygenase (phytanoyl-CoA dioxygenase family)